METTATNKFDTDNMQDIKDSVVNATECVTESAECVADSASKEMKDKVRYIRESLKNAACYVEDLASKTSKEAGEIANNVGHRLSDVGDNVVTEIRRKPVQSAVIALLAGGLLGGFLLSSRGSRRR